MPVRKWVAVIALSVVVNGTLYAEAAPALRSTPAPRSLRDAIARQHQPLLAVPPSIRAMPPGRKGSSRATKATAGVALGFVGFWVGAFTAFVVENAAHTSGDGKRGIYVGGTIGAGAGAALGVWLASR